MQIQLIRHATLLVQMNSKRILVDPMLCSAGEMPPIENSTNDRRNPLVDLPISLKELFPLDAVVLTHLHRDHFDHTAIEAIPKNTIIFCQPVDEPKLRKLGFLKVFGLDVDIEWEGIGIIRTSGQHGVGEIGRQMGLVSGFVFSTKSEPSLYIAGDTIYCQEVEQTLVTHQPKIVVVNAGGAQFKTGSPITMTAQDVISVCKRSDTSKIVAVHMEAINHCLESREQLKQTLRDNGYEKRVSIPLDGEVLTIKLLNSQEV